MDKMNPTLYFSQELMAATGRIDYPLKNDVILHCISQRSNAFLKFLVSSFTGLPMKDIKSVELLNPIDFRTYNGKELILDIKICLNDAKILNFEMQLSLNYGAKWWINRSVLYLCRSFDNLERGIDYSKIKPATHISIIDEDLFPDSEPEFYAHYKLLNEKTHKPYTSHFNLNVLYLNHINLATQEDIDNHLVEWAEAFSATSWEELKQLAMNNPDFLEVAEMMCAVDSDKMTRAVAEAHDKYLHDIASFKEEGRQEGISIGQAMAAEEILRLRKIIESAGLSIDET